MEPHVICATKHDGNDKTTTYLGTSRIRGQDELEVEHKTPITERCYIYGKLWDGINCKILLHMGLSISSISKTSYLSYPSLESFAAFELRTKNILLGNNQYVGILFTLPVVITLYEC